MKARFYNVKPENRGGPTLVTAEPEWAAYRVKRSEVSIPHIDQYVQELLGLLLIVNSQSCEHCIYFYVSLNT